MQRQNKIIKAIVNTAIIVTLTITVTIMVVVLEGVTVYVVLP